MPCCNAKRPTAPNGIAGYVRYGEAPREDLIATSTPAWWVNEAESFGKAVRAGVGIWVVTRLLDKIFSKVGRR